MLKKVIFLAIILAAVLALIIWGVSRLNSLILQNGAWILAGAIIAGTLSGVIRAIFKGVKITPNAVEKNERHTVDSFLEHWGTGIGIFILIYSGFQIRFQPGQLFPMNLHFVGLVYTLVFGSYFMADFLVSQKYHDLLPNITDITDGTIKKYLFRAKWVDRGKYLSSQKSAILAFAFLGVGILLTGSLKVAGHFWSIPPVTLNIATSLHDLISALFIIMLVVHLALVMIVRHHRNLLGSWFNGKVKEAGSETVGGTDRDKLQSEEAIRTIILRLFE